MKFLRRLFEKRDRALSHSDLFLRGADIDVGVTPWAAENLSGVMACVSAISTCVASVPIYVYRENQKGRVLVEGHPVTRMIRNGPNANQTMPDFVEWYVRQVLLHGNAVAEILVDGAGRLSGLKPVPWENLSIQVLPSGRLAYDIVEATSLGGVAGRRRRLLADDVIHLRDASDDGVVGRSRLQRAAAVVSGGLHVQQFSSSLFRNGVHPSGVLMAEGRLSTEALSRLQEHFRQTFSGSRNAARALVLDSGLKWTSVSISPEDAELLQSRRFTVEEICRIYQVPPPIIQDYQFNTFTNSESAGRWFCQFTITPWVRKIEAAFNRSIFSDPAFHLEFDLSGFLRGDPETRWKSHEIAVKNGILAVNEIRGLEGWDPRQEVSDVPPQE